MRKSIVEVMSDYQQHINYMWWRFDYMLNKQYKEYKQKQELLFLQGKENTHKPQLMLEEKNKFHNWIDWEAYLAQINFIDNHPLNRCMGFFVDNTPYQNKPNIQIIDNGSTSI